VFRFVLGKLWPGNRNRPLDNNSAVELRMTFRCMPAFQTLGGGDCGASWVSASRLRCRNRRHSGGSQMRVPDDPSSADSWNTWRSASIYSAGFDALWRLRRRFPSLRPRGVPRQTPINRTRYKGLVSIFARARFYSINSLSSFSKRCYRLGISGLR